MHSNEFSWLMIKKACVDQEVSRKLHSRSRHLQLGYTCTPAARVHHLVVKTGLWFVGYTRIDLRLELIF